MCPIIDLQLLFESDFGQNNDLWRLRSYTSRRVDRPYMETLDKIDSNFIPWLPSKIAHRYVAIQFRKAGQSSCSSRLAYFISSQKELQ